MPTATTRPISPVPVPTAPTLHLAPDLGNTLWKLAFATSIAHAPRLRTAPARGLARPDAEIAGIVAEARKLLVALWRHRETGVLPEGALLKA